MAKKNSNQPRSFRIYIDPQDRQKIELKVLGECLIAEMPKAVKGVLIECDASIKAIILKLDARDHGFIVEDLDEHTMVVKESRLAELKDLLEKELEYTQPVVEDSASE